VVEPIIDEYEKTISNLEAEIERYKAAMVSHPCINMKHRALTVILSKSRNRSQKSTRLKASHLEFPF
jgi:hypothetical protein